MRPTAAVVWCWRHPRTTVFVALVVAGFVHPVWWLLTPPAIAAGIVHLPDALGAQHGGIRADVIPGGQLCPHCGVRHDGTVEVGIDANGDARCIDLDLPQEPDATGPVASVRSAV